MELKEYTPELYQNLLSLKQMRNELENLTGDNEMRWELIKGLNKAITAIVFCLNPLTLAP